MNHVVFIVFEITKFATSEFFLYYMKIDFADINQKMFAIIKQMSPFGPQNMRPVFMASGLRDNGYGKKVGEDETHLKLNIFEASNQATYSAIGFGMGDKFDIISRCFYINL